MKKQRRRVEIVQPEWIRDPSKWPFGKVILPLPLTPPQRVLLGEKELARLLRCPRDVVRAFLKRGQLHEASAAEKEASLGLCAEDLAALGLGGLLCMKYNMPLGARVQEAIQELRSELLEATRPLRVILAVLCGNRGYEMRVATTHAVELAVWDVPSDLRRAMDFYDASKLRDEIEISIAAVPLKFPSPGSCLVARPPEV